MLNTSNRKSFIILIALFSLVSLSVEEVFAEVVLEDFSSYSNNRKLTDKDWKARDGDANSVYAAAAEDGNLFLHASDKGNSVQVFRKRGWKLRENPVFSWKWRVIKFPKGSNEDSGLNDSAAGVYVVFPNRWFVPESIKYLWSETLPVGTVIIRHDHFPMLVIRSGKAEEGKWITEERNIYDDYKKLFGGRSPADPVAFGMLTDANDTKSESIADYDDFKAIEKTSSEPTPIKIKK